MGTNMTANGGADRKLAELAEEVLRLQKLNTQLGSGQAATAAEPATPEQAAPEPALAPLVDRIAHGFAKSLVMALKELEKHIAAETRKVGDSLERRLDALQASIAEQRSLSLSLKESDARQDAELAALRSELSVQQEDIAAIKSNLSGLSSRSDNLLERLDRQAETLRSMCGTYAQRETELEQLVEGLARLRAFPAPPPTQGL